MDEARIRLVGRADDAGSCRGANAAIREVAEAGLALNVGLMAPGPAFEEAAEMLARLPGTCVGLHATITAEWDTLKWGPVLPPERVPSLVDEAGRFHPDVTVIHERGGRADEVLAEVEAQLARARACGLRIDYLDEHMGFGWLPGVGEGLAALCQREGLLAGRLGAEPLPRVSGYFKDVTDEFIARLEAARPGTYIVVTHPGRDDEEMRRLVHPGLKPGQVARERAGDTRMLTAPRVLDYCRSHGVVPVRFTDIAGRPAAARPGGLT